MMKEVKNGAGDCSIGDVSDKVLLLRGCDPVLAERSKQFLPQMLGNVRVVATTDDDTFFAALKQQKYDAVCFAPGACRWSAARQPIPGGNQATRGWTLDQYREKVREIQGQEVSIVESTMESELVPLLRRALQLP